MFFHSFDSFQDLSTGNAGFLTLYDGEQKKFCRFHPAFGWNPNRKLIYQRQEGRIGLSWLFTIS
jgi:hypothetical protein